MLKYILSLVLILSTLRLAAISLPDGFEDALVLADLRDPASMAFAPDGRLFFGERITGKLRVATYDQTTDEWTIQPDPFYQFDVPSERHRSSGLRGFCFDPNFDVNGYIYAFYMQDNPRHNRVVRIQADPANSAIALAESETVLMEAPFNGTISSGSHNGGDILVGNDNMLYFTTGDGWNGGNNVQSLETYTGKLFRIGTDGSIPSDNPFYDTASGDLRGIYAIGLRNPYTMAMNTASGDIFINEARGTNKADIYRVDADGTDAGANFGHDGYNGLGTLKGAWKNASSAGGKLITGGTWYPSSGYWPSTYHNNYFAALWGGNGSDTDGRLITISSDLSNATVSSFASAVFASPGRHKPVMTKIGPEGDLYYLLTDYETGNAQIRKIRYTGVLTASSPIFSPDPGAYENSVQLTLTSNTPGVSIYYTTDGTAPSASSALFSTSISISETQTIRSIAIASGYADSPISTATYTIGPIENIPPIANAGPDLIVVLGERTTLNGAASYDPDGSPLEIVEDWEQVSGPSVIIEDADETVANFTPVELGSYVFRITITDVEGAVDTDETTITVVDEIDDILDGLVARWTMDEGSGTVIQDYSANSYNGSISGASFEIETEDNSAYSLGFDGLDNRVDVGVMDLSNAEMSISFWFKAESFGVSDARFISKASGQFDDDHYWMVSTLNSNKLRFRLKTGGVTTTLSSAAGAIITNEWFHVTAVYNGSSMILYKNGEEIARTVKQGNIDTNPNVNVAIGNQPASASGGGRPFHGLLDEMRIYGRALTVAEIQTIMQVPADPIRVQGGILQRHLDSLVAAMPGSSGDQYQDPDDSEKDRWKEALELILENEPEKAHRLASTFEYEVIRFIDTTEGNELPLLILQKTNSSLNHWGTLIFNNRACRPVALQAPHVSSDTNTGSESAYIFSRFDASSLMIAGSHRCNNSVPSSCSGAMSACGSNSAYTISDQAHNVNGTFQITTKVLSEHNPHLTFVQLHGFAQEAGDPDLILSNGTRVAPSVDPTIDLKLGVLNYDADVTFKTGHVDLEWNRLLGFTNVQGRLVNESSDACLANATSSAGKFLHLEQSFLKFRKDESGWALMLEGLKSAFPISEENTWVGGAYGSWIDNGTNWSTGRIPSSCDHVTIPSGVEVTLPEGVKAIVRELTVGEGGFLNIRPSAVLEVKE